MHKYIYKNSKTDKKMDRLKVCLRKKKQLISLKLNFDLQCIQFYIHI